MTRDEVEGVEWLARWMQPDELFWVLHRKDGRDNLVGNIVTIYAGMRTIEDQGEQGEWVLQLRLLKPSLVEGLENFYDEGLRL